MDVVRDCVIVTGGAGFVGTHLLQRLVKNGAFRVVSIDIRDPGSPVEGVEYVKGDVRDLSKFEIDAPVPTIYNLAAVHKTPGHPQHEYYETNVLGAAEVAAFARRHNVKNIVFTSSISVYGPGEERKAETAALVPETAYGWSKFLAERIHRDWLEEDVSRRLVIVRPGVIFGAGERGNFTRMARLLKHGLFVYPGRQDTVKACIYVEDLLDVFESVLMTSERFVTLNACYPDRYTVKGIVDAFKTAGLNNIRELTIPYWAVHLVALFLAPFSSLGLGIHPDRVNKLVRSTDIYPEWLVKNGLAKESRLPEVLRLWSEDSQGKFE